MLFSLRSWLHSFVFSHYFVFQTNLRPEFKSPFSTVLPAYHLMYFQIDRTVSETLAKMLYKSVRYGNYDTSGATL